MFRMASVEIYKKFSQSCSIVLKSWKMGGEGTSQMKNIIMYTAKFSAVPLLEITFVKSYDYFITLYM